MSSPAEISFARLTKFFFIGSFYAAPVLMFIVSAYLLDEEGFTRFNSVFLTVGLISFLVDFGDEISIPKLEMENSLSYEIFLKHLFRRIKRACLLSSLIFIAAVAFGSPADLLWVFFPPAGALTLAFWYKAKGQMMRFIRASMPVRLAVIFAFPFYAYSEISVLIACFTFYFVPSFFLIVFDSAVWPPREVESVNTSALGIGEQGGFGGFVLLVCNLLLGWLPFFLVDRGSLEISYLGLVFIRSTGYLSQLFGMLSSLMHRQIWMRSVSLSSMNIRFVSTLTISTSCAIFLGMIGAEFYSGSSAAVLATYMVGRLFFFILVFILLVHITDMFWLSWASIPLVLCWPLAVLIDEISSPFILINLSYAIGLALLGYHMRGLARCL